MNFVPRFKDSVNPYVLPNWAENHEKFFFFQNLNQFRTKKFHEKNSPWKYFLLPKVLKAFHEFPRFSENMLEGSISDFYIRASTGIIKESLSMKFRHFSTSMFHTLLIQNTNLSTLIFLSQSSVDLLSGIKARSDLFHRVVLLQFDEKSLNINNSFIFAFQNLSIKGENLIIDV